MPGKQQTICSTDFQSIGRVFKAVSPVQPLIEKDLQIHTCLIHSHGYKHTLFFKSTSNCLLLCLLLLLLALKLQETTDRLLSCRVLKFVMTLRATSIGELEKLVKS